MILAVDEATPQRLVLRLREGQIETTVSSPEPWEAAARLINAVEAACREGYGECFWPEPTGQYWWTFRLDDRRLDVALMWSRGGATGWQHVFRAADEVSYFVGVLKDELGRQGLLEP